MVQARGVSAGRAERERLTVAVVKQATEAAVSHRIRRLERRVGAKLFDRHHDGLEVNPSARSVLKWWLPFGLYPTSMIFAVGAGP